MFAQLGDIKFELITYFNGLNETVSYNYAQHERIENKPILQFLGKNLQEEDIKLLDELKRTDKKYGLVTMCIGGGMGAAGIYEMC